MHQKKVCIIGAGISGLTAIKACLEEGLVPVCLEQQDHLGGSWHINQDGSPSNPDLGIVCRMFSAVITNTSRKMTEFSDFPMPKDFPTFIPARKLIEYIKSYSDNFGLAKYVQNGIRVDDVSKTDDYVETGNWRVTYTDIKKTGNPQYEEVFSKVMVCNGIFNEQITPTFPGLDQFEGQVIHGGDYFNSDPYKGKNVLVIGSSFSASDIAVDCCRVSKNTYLSARKGLWIMPRMVNGKQPWDATLFSRPLINWIPFKLRISEWGRNLKNNFDYKGYHVEPKKGFLKQPVCISDEIQSRIVCGALKVKPGIERFSKNSVHFTDGTVYEDIDVVVMATGYRMKCPFIKDKTIVPDNCEDVEMYKHMFPVNDPKHSMAFINYLRVLGSVLPTSELQSRVAARMFAGHIQLPSTSEMRNDVTKHKARITNQWGNCVVPKEFVHFYYQELAAILGVKPDIMRLLVDDPALAMKCLFGPAMPSQYRLFGPNSNFTVARRAILDLKA